jgi:hypothetical protein
MFTLYIFDLERMLTWYSDPSGAEKREVSPGGKPDVPTLDDRTDAPKVDETATAILRKPKKPNSLM